MSNKEMIINEEVKPYWWKEFKTHCYEEWVEDVCYSIQVSNNEWDENSNGEYCYFMFQVSLAGEDMGYFKITSEDLEDENELWDRAYECLVDFLTDDEDF